MKKDNKKYMESMIAAGTKPTQIRGVRCLDYKTRTQDISEKLTEKQTLVYLYLLGLSDHNSKNKNLQTVENIAGVSQVIEDHYYLYKENVPDIESAKILKISAPTYRAAIVKLIELGYIDYRPAGYTHKTVNGKKIERIENLQREAGQRRKRDKDKFLIDITPPYIPLSKKTIFTIIDKGPSGLQGRVVMTLGILKGAFEIIKQSGIKELELSLNNIATYLYKTVHAKQINDIWKIIMFLKETGLITLKWQNEINKDKQNGIYVKSNEYNGKPYLTFTLIDVNVKALDEKDDVIHEIDYGVLRSDVIEKGIRYLEQNK